MLFLYRSGYDMRKDLKRPDEKIDKKKKQETNGYTEINGDNKTN